MKHVPLLLALLLVLVAPIALRPKADRDLSAAERTLVIITPHNEAIRYEFARGFERWYLAKTGQRVRVDYRTPGGTSEIGRYVTSEYVAAFENHWTHTLGKPWSSAVERAFASAKLKLDNTPADDTPEEAARRAFLASEVSCKLDVFFGGGAYDFQQQANAGYLVDTGFAREHPELFGPNGAIPQTLSGEPFWDKEGRWIGSVVSAFGIVCNTDALHRLGIAQPPARWDELADPRYAGQVALANPSQSSSVTKSFEMLIQQQMQEEVEGRRSKVEGGVLSADAEKEAVAAGWDRAMRLLQRIGANARYFTDTSTKISLDVGAGDCAAGMTIDFYGRFQSQIVARPDGSSVVQYVNAVGGTSVGVDPIGIFRGAPHADIAKEFITFVMSPEGQRLWNWKVGSPGGPGRYALRRLPVLPALYADEFKPLRSDPDVAPYELAKSFQYHPAWTGPLFSSVGFIFRVMCVDTHHELAAAWRALIEAGFPPEATAEFSRVDQVDYAAASGRIRETFGPVKINEVRLAKELADGFRAQYRRTEELARARR
jgi:ABC-type Fe3+ transport system substrate-binding protein